MVHWRGLDSGVSLGWTPVPSIGSCGLGSSKITASVGERETEERESKREHGEVGEKNDGFGKKKEKRKKKRYFCLDDVRNDFNPLFCILVDFV
jgi:hypothetical protein